MGKADDGGEVCSLHEVNGRKAGDCALGERAEDGDAEFFHGMAPQSNWTLGKGPPAARRA